ncbi:MAG TPA: cytochrome c biogenesis protein ResB [Thermodesulfobacteriota bacterium]
MDIKHIVSFAAWMRALAWSYRRLSSIETSVYLLCLLAVSFIVGTIFPQGGDFDEYVKEGGRFVLLVEVFDLLEFFSSPLFLSVALLFILNLVICTYERYKALFMKRKLPESFTPTKSFLVTQDAIRAHEETRRILMDIGFRLVDKDNAWTAMERGLPYRWLTWAYHAGIVVCLAGILFTFLFAFEDTITLNAGSPQTVIPATTGRVQRIWQDATPQTDYHLLLDSFTTEYEESHELDYPEDKKARLALGLGWKLPEHRISSDPLFATAWKAGLKAVGSSGTVLAEKEIEINEPMKHGGYTFYLMGFEQRLKLRVNDSFMPLDVKADDDVIIPGSTVKLSLGTLRSGKVKRLDGSVEELTPYVTVKDSESRDDPALLRLNQSVIVDGNVVTLVGFTEQAILSYRYDPGVALLWIGGIIVLIALALRLYGSYYLLAYRVDDADAIVSVNFSVTSKGVFAHPERIEGRIEELLTEGDLKPLALPERP